MAATETVEAKWEALASQDEMPEVFFGEEYEAPNEFWFYTKMFDSSSGQYDCTTDDVFQTTTPQETTLAVHPNAARLLSEDKVTLEPGCCWYDIVYYCSASDDGYRNGRSNGGLLKIQKDRDGAMIRGELRPTAVEFLSEYCGLQYRITQEKGQTNNRKGDMIKFDAPERFVPGTCNINEPPNSGFCNKT